MYQIGKHSVVGKEKCEKAGERGWPRTIRPEASDNILFFYPTETDSRFNSS
jgi:hypothetical protein